MEPRWYAFWLEQGVFEASLEADDARPTYVIDMPPPNVTGSLHMGHALGGTIQDVLIRHKRMEARDQKFALERQRAHLVEGRALVAELG